jgi:hypothetical protein
MEIVLRAHASDESGDIVDIDQGTDRERGSGILAAVTGEVPCPEADRDKLESGVCWRFWKRVTA